MPRIVGIGIQINMVVAFLHGAMIIFVHGMVTTSMMSIIAAFAGPLTATMGARLMQGEVVEQQFQRHQVTGGKLLAILG